MRTLLDMRETTTNPELSPEQAYLESLEAIRTHLIADWRKPWPGAEHGKAIVGMAVDAAIAQVRGVR